MTHRRPATEAIVEWYDRKTEFLLEKSAPGRGCITNTGGPHRTSSPPADRSGLRRQLWCSQEDMNQASRTGLVWRREPQPAISSMSVAVWVAPSILLRGRARQPRHRAQSGWRATSSGSPASRSRPACVSAYSRCLATLTHSRARAIRRPRFSFDATTYFDRESYFESGRTCVVPAVGCSSRTPSSAAPNWLRRSTSIGPPTSAGRTITSPRPCSMAFDLFRLEDISRHRPASGS